jgi:hypothetical protein
MRKTAILIAFLSLISAWSINQFNLSELRKDGVELRLNETVITADDASYIAPAQNFISSGELKNNVNDKSAYFLRPPGYSFWLILHGGVETSGELQVLKITQTLLFALSVYLLFFIAFEVLRSKKLAIIISSIYGVSTIASGFLFYTLTEAITPALVIVFAYFLVQAQKSSVQKTKIILYFSSALAFALLFITRPVLGVFVLPLIVFLVSDFWSKKKQLLFMATTAGFIAFSPMIIWQIRCATIANHYTGLHPIYNNEHSATSFRPVHGAFWNFCKSWGENGAIYHSYTEAFWQRSIKGDTSQHSRNKIIERLPKSAVTVLGKAI